MGSYSSYLFLGVRPVLKHSSLRKEGMMEDFEKGVWKFFVILLFLMGIIFCVNFVVGHPRLTFLGIVSLVGCVGALIIYFF